MNNYFLWKRTFFGSEQMFIFLKIKRSNFGSEQMFSIDMSYRSKNDQNKRNTLKFCSDLYNAAKMEIIEERTYFGSESL